MKKTGKCLVGLCGMIAVLFVTDMVVYARTTTLEEGTVFDSDYYADTYPDLKEAFGYDYDAAAAIVMPMACMWGRSLPSIGIHICIK